MKIIATFAKQIITLTDQEYQKVLPVISDMQSRFCQIHGQTYNINDFRFMGDASEAPEELKESIKAQKERIETPDSQLALARLFFTGKTPSGWKNDVKDLATKIWKEHVARRPDIDASMESLRTEIAEQRKLINKTQYGIPAEV